MPDISLRPSRIDDSWHAEREGSIIASGRYKDVLADVRLACGPGDHIVRGSSIAMGYPPPKAPKAEAPKANNAPAPKAGRKPGKSKAPSAPSAPSSSRPGTSGDDE